MNENRPFWRRKYVWLPTLLAIYFIFMAVYFGSDLIAAGKVSTFIGIAAGETVVLILLFIFLKKRQKKG